MLAFGSTFMAHTAPKELSQGPTCSHRRLLNRARILLRAKPFLQTVDSGTKKRGACRASRKEGMTPSTFDPDSSRRWLKGKVSLLPVDPEFIPAGSFSTSIGIWCLFFVNFGRSAQKSSVSPLSCRRLMSKLLRWGTGLLV